MLEQSPTSDFKLIANLWFLCYVSVVFLLVVAKQFVKQKHNTEILLRRSNRRFRHSTTREEEEKGRNSSDDADL